MKWFVAAIAASLVGYYFLQSLEDRKSAAKGLPPASAGKRIATFFFITIITTVLFYLVSNMWDTPPLLPGGAPEAMPRLDRTTWSATIKNIKQDVDVGSAPF